MDAANKQMGDVELLSALSRLSGLQMVISDFTKRMYYLCTVSCLIMACCPRTFGTLFKSYYKNNNNGIMGSSFPSTKTIRCGVLCGEDTACQAFNMVWDAGQVRKLGTCQLITTLAELAIFDEQATHYSKRIVLF
jgi:hypothetical protein